MFSTPRLTRDLILLLGPEYLRYKSEMGWFEMKGCSEVFIGYGLSNEKEMGG